MLFLCLGIVLAALAIGFALHARSRDGADQSAGAGAKRAPTPVRHCQAGEIGSGSRRVSYAAFVRTGANVYRRPGGERLSALPRLSKSYVRTNQGGVPTVVAVLGEVRASDCRARWYRIRLPGQPGVSAAREGYVRAGLVALAERRTRIVIDLSLRRLTLFENGAPILTTPAAVGTPATPTPRGRFIVKERIRVTDSGSAFGAAAIALSAYSQKLIYWPEGGPVAIHGTNDPSSIGRAVSHGCIRLSAGALARVFARVQLGTPVEIVS